MSVSQRQIAVDTEPTKKVGTAWISFFAVAWFGIWFAQLTPIQLLLPSQVTAVMKMNPDDWVGNVVAFGVVSGIAGVVALIAYPLAGALSDRTTSRFGRRRPWILGGGIAFGASLALLGIQNNIFGVGVFWALALGAFCVCTSALTAVISDQVPVLQRATVSGWMAAPQPIGVLLGIGAVVLLELSLLVGYLLSAIIVVVCVAAFAFWMPDAPLDAADRPELTFKSFLRGFWINPQTHPDFGWTLLARVLVNIGNALTTTLLLYFLIFGIGLGANDANTTLLIITVVYSIFSIVASIWVGRLSDKLQRRKQFVVVTSIMQGVAGLLLLAIPSVPSAIVAGALSGFGFGAFLAVDQALATQVLPSAHDRGKDLGIMNIAYAIPQAFAPLLGAGLVVLVNGFWLLFAGVIVCTALGALALAPVKGVK